MRITKIQAKNFRILQNSVMDFDRDLCLLLGRNNTGKTSFMSLINQKLEPVKTTNKNINYDHIDNKIKTKVSDNIYRGIKILYRNKVYPLKC